MYIRFSHSESFAILITLRVSSCSVRFVHAIKLQSGKSRRRSRDTWNKDTSDFILIARFGLNDCACHEYSAKCMDVWFFISIRRVVLKMHRECGLPVSSNILIDFRTRGSISGLTRTSNGWNVDACNNYLAIRCYTAEVRSSGRKKVYVN